LNKNGIEARSYYSGVTAEGYSNTNTYRQHLEDLLLSNQIKVLVATTALGMGYDKPDLGFVVHYQAPGSIVAYYQQVGRAGRAIHHAVGLLMSGREDDEIQAYFRNSAFPSEQNVNMLLQALVNNDGMNERQLEGVVNLPLGQIQHVLKFLSVENPAPVFKDNSVWRRTAVRWQMDHAKIRRLTRQRIEEWKEVQTYIGTRDCLMLFLARALDDPDPRPCGKCANCLGAPVIPATFKHQIGVTATRYVKQAEIPLECKKQAAAGALTIYNFRYNLPAALRAETGRILSRWGDAGWGAMIKKDKPGGHFRDELVEATAEMIQTRWQPVPAPTWVTAVPSNRHRNLVPDFACRLATRLGLPFVSAVSKIRDNDPQKLKANRFHQCRNLDGVFGVAGMLPSGPVLLVDDIVDSAWTLTVVAAILRQAGSDVVYPLALATTSTGD
jgi:ATP-dependent DNA helicase RecQ